MAITLAVMAIGAVQVLGYATESAPPYAPAYAEPTRTAAPGIVVVTSSGSRAPVEAPPAPAATPTSASWFANVAATAAMAAQRLVAEPSKPMPAAAVTSRDAVRPTRTSPPPPPPVDIAAAIATARAAEPTIAPRPSAVDETIGAVAPLQPTGAPARSSAAASVRPTARPAAAALLPTSRVVPSGRTSVQPPPPAAQEYGPAASSAAGAVRAAAPVTSPPPREPERTRDAPAARTTLLSAPQTPATPVALSAMRSPPTVRNGDAKWGVGAYRESDRVLDQLRATQPGVILLMDPTVGFARTVREQHPNAFIIGRRHRAETDQPLDDPERRGEQFADLVAELGVPLRGVVDAWMSYNEVTQSHSTANYGDYNRFQVAFARKLQNVHGLAAVAGNDGSGAIDPELYPRYFGEAIAASQYFGVHAYSPPKSASIQQDAQWNVLRYRKIHDALERAGIRGKQMVITESGLGDGFRRGVSTDEQMATGFAWLTQELRKDPYMIGQAAFGIFDKRDAQWDRFELTDSSVLGALPSLLRR